MEKYDVVIKLIDSEIVERNYVSVELYKPKKFYAITRKTDEKIVKNLKKVVNCTFQDVLFEEVLLNRDIEIFDVKKFLSTIDVKHKILMDIGTNHSKLALLFVEAIKMDQWLKERCDIVSIDVNAQTIDTYKLVNNSINIITNNINLKNKYSLNNIIKLRGALMYTNLHTEPPFKYFDDILRICRIFFTDVEFFNIITLWIINATRISKLTKKSLFAKKGLYLKGSLYIDLSRYFSHERYSINANKKVFIKLQKIGVIRDLNFFEEKIKDNKVIECVEFSFVNTLFEKSFEVKGTWLEMYVFIMLKKSQLFDEVYMSSEIDWNGIINEENNLYNEIDVVALKNNVPVFISCKIPAPDMKAILEIEYYTKKFAGSFAIPVIATLYVGINPILKNRIQNMDIKLIDKNTLLDTKSFNKFIMKI